MSHLDRTAKGRGGPNMLAEVLERRKNEGDYRFFLKPKVEGSGGTASKLGSLVHMGVILLAAGVIFAFLVMPKGEAKRDPNIPAAGVRASAAPAGDQTAPSNAGEPAEPKPPAGNAAGAADEAAGRPPAFIPVEDVFTQMPKLDPIVLEQAMDDYRTLNNVDAAAIANDIGPEGHVVAHIYQFLRSHPPVELAALADPTLTQGDMLRDPDACRGKIITLRVQLVKKYMTFTWPKNPSGVRSATMLFCYSVSGEHGRSIFVVLVPRPLESFKEGAMYQLTGVFMKRYPYRVEPGSDIKGWRWQPLILTMEMASCAQPAFISQRVSVAIVVVAALVLIALLFLVRGETREGADKRRERVERQRQTRERVKQRTGSARLTPPFVRKDDDKPPESGGPPPGG